jgi:hypothetical protein
MVGVLGWIISPVTCPHLQGTTEEMWTDIRASSGIPTYDPSVRAGDTLLRPRENTQIVNFSKMPQQCGICYNKHY